MAARSAASQNPVRWFPKAPCSGLPLAAGCRNRRENHRCGQKRRSEIGQPGVRRMQRGDLCFGRPHTGFWVRGKPGDRGTRRTGQAGSKTTRRVRRAAGQGFGRPVSPPGASNSSRRIRSGLAAGQFDPPPAPPMEAPITTHSLGIEGRAIAPNMASRWASTPGWGIGAYAGNGG